jgi:hypothetical protein
MPDLEVQVHGRPGAWSAACPRCSWRREFATARGVVNRLAEHLLQRHHIRLLVEKPREVA